jgi:hypothetical protein
MHEPKVTWEACRSGAGITIRSITQARKFQVKRIVGTDDGKIKAFGADGREHVLMVLDDEGRETSAEVASIAGELLNLDAADLDTLDMTKGSLSSAELLAKIHKVAASCLGQRAD